MKFHSWGDEASNERYRYVRHICNCIHNEPEGTNITTDVCYSKVRYIRVRSYVTGVVRCPYCGERVA